MNDELYNVVRRRLLRRLKDFPHIVSDTEFYLGGNSLNKERPNDFDIFPISKESSFTHLQGEVVFETPNARTVKYEDNLYQFCKFYKNSLQELVESFDFSHIQVGAKIKQTESGNFIIEEVYFTDAYVSSKLTETSHFMGSEYPLSSALRIVKYNQRGLFNKTQYSTEFIKILTAIYARGFFDYNDFKQQLDAVDLAMLLDKMDEADLKVFLNFFELLRRDR